MYVLSDSLGDELRDAQMLLAAAIHGEERLRRLADAEPPRSAPGLDTTARTLSDAAAPARSGVK